MKTITKFLRWKDPHMSKTCQIQMKPPYKQLKKKKPNKQEEITTKKTYREALYSQNISVARSKEISNIEPKSEARSDIETKSIEEKGNTAVEEELIPEIRLPSQLSTKLSQRWKRPLIIRTFELIREMETLKRILQNLWKTRGAMDLKEIGYGFFFIIHELLEEDRTKIITAHPWRLDLSTKIERKSLY